MKTATTYPPTSSYHPPLGTLAVISHHLKSRHGICFCTPPKLFAALSPVFFCHISWGWVLVGGEGATETSWQCYTHPHKWYWGGVVRAMCNGVEWWKYIPLRYHKKRGVFPARLIRFFLLPSSLLFVVVLTHNTSPYTLWPIIEFATRRYIEAHSATRRPTRSSWRCAQTSKTPVYTTNILFAFIVFSLLAMQFFNLFFSFRLPIGFFVATPIL